MGCVVGKAHPASDESGTNHDDIDALRNGSRQTSCQIEQDVDSSRVASAQTTDCRAENCNNSNPVSQSPDRQGSPSKASKSSVTGQPGESVKSQQGTSSPSSAATISHSLSKGSSKSTQGDSTSKKSDLAQRSLVNATEKTESQSHAELSSVPMKTETSDPRKGSGIISSKMEHKRNEDRTNQGPAEHSNQSFMDAAIRYVRLMELPRCSMCICFE